MDHFGLALSGGGFRGTLYHLGVVRFLRDAGLLGRVTHITSVSGGSILGAHLALHWDRYCGSDRDFDEVSAELIRFTQLDVRNRIVRRFPMTSSINMLRRLLWLGGNRKLTRPGLLECHYEKFLYGDVPLSQLPARPHLHILATNLSEGCLCAFNRDGLLLQRRASGKRDRFERVGMGLATVPMAVAASSAFPGFFPPLELDGWDVGAVKGEFDRQAFTDGGVYDNLGLRMFRCIEQSWIREAAPLVRDDLLAPKEMAHALQSATQMPEGTPLRQISDMLIKYGVNELHEGEPATEDERVNSITKGLWEIIRTERLYRSPAFQEMELVDPAAQSLFQFLRSSKREPEVSDRLWVNRQIIESALQQAIGKPCLRMSSNKFRSILVSDAGGKFKVASDGRAGGLVRTALRSTDILMDRVYQLELEAFENTFGLISCPIGAIVEPSQDNHALNPELQRQAARIRTDLDRFTDLEVTTLIKHGYCIARSAVRKTGVEIPGDVVHGPPWTPRIGKDSPSQSTADSTQTVAEVDGELDLKMGRELRNSSRRTTWSTALSLTDWPTYVWVPLIVLLLFSLPYAYYKSQEKSRHQEMVLSAIAQTSPLYRTIVKLLGELPANPPAEVTYTETEELQPSNIEGFEILSDSRVYDLRGWNLKSTSRRALFYDRLRVRRTADAIDPLYRIQMETVDSELAFACQNRSLTPTFFRKESKESFVWEMQLDFSRVPRESDVDILFDGALPSDKLLDTGDAASFAFNISTKTGISQIWILMPSDRIYKDFEIVRYPVGEPGMAEFVTPDSQVELPIGAITTFRLLNPETDFHYECRWRWGTEAVANPWPWN